MRALSAPAPNRSAVLGSAVLGERHCDRRSPRREMLARLPDLYRRRDRRRSHPAAISRRRRLTREHPTRLRGLQSPEA